MEWRTRSGWRAMGARRAMPLVGIMAALAVTLAACAPTSGGSTQQAGGSMPAYQHIFLIVMENRSYDDVIGNAGAPRINALANTYGLATNYWGVTHPSEPNYVAMIGGDYFGIQDDNSYVVNAVDAPNLMSQLEAAGQTWKSYQQSLPYAGYTGETYPAPSPLYASKHNPIMNYLTYWSQSQRQATLAKSVPDSQLQADLASGSAPTFSFISPDLCHDMHGAISCGSADALLAAGDTYVGDTVDAIKGSSAWKSGNTAIIITWDEADAGLSLGGPGGIATGGGHVATIVVTNHGLRGVKDNSAYNHYSLLRTIEDALHLGCLKNSCSAQPMTPLFTISGN